MSSELAFHISSIISIIDGTNPIIINIENTGQANLKRLSLLI